MIRIVMFGEEGSLENMFGFERKELLNGSMKLL